MNRLSFFLNPIKRLGYRRYSLIVPLTAMLLLSVLVEIYAWYILSNPEQVGLIAIFMYVSAIIYLAFRDGIKGGLIAVIITISYYLYIIYSRNYAGDQLTSGIRTTAALGVVYTLLALIIGWLKQTIDILILKEADERRRLESVLQQLPVGVLVTDSTGKVIQSNRQVEAILGQPIRRGQSAIDKIPVHIKNNSRSISSSHWPIALAVNTGKSVLSKEFEITHENGKNRFVQISASLIKSKDGTPIAAASIFNDITMQKEFELRKDDFVNMASHELKTPITSLKLYLELLERHLSQQKDTKGTKTIRSIKYQTDRLQELVSDLLDVSRLQTGKLSLHKETFRLDLMINETIEHLKESASGHTIEYTQQKPILVVADQFRIYQVLTNLITNAVKYSPKNTKITISVKSRSGIVTVSVRDQGIGIDSDQLKKVFDRLYQVTDSKEKTFPGLGMGLYISKEIIKRHKGTIWVESTKGKGSTFYFSIPK